MIRTEQLTFRIGAFELDRLSLEIPRGKYFVLLGPPGAGKSMFLECLCGLRRAAGGRVFLDGQDVTHAQPRRRGIGYVPQDYALFPHLSVAENVAFGLRRMHCDRSRWQARVQEATQLLGIGHLLARRTAGLSGGERQRVALARALVLRPRILLLDEPVCALDEATRQEVCGQLLRLQRQLELTVVHVSHNLEEAFSVADLAAILHQGRLQQFGPIDELLRRPNSEFVARFVRTENIFSGRVRAEPQTPVALTRVELDHAAVDVPGRHEGTVQFMIRPDQVLVLPAGEAAPTDVSQASCPPLEGGSVSRTSCPRFEGGTLPTQTGYDHNRFDLQMVAWRDCGAYIRLELTGPINLIAHATPAAFAQLRHSARLTAVLPLPSIHVLS